MSGCRSRLPWRTRKQCLSKHIPASIADLLYDSSSLTARLIDKCKGRFHVKVLSETRATATPDEIKALHMSSRRYALIRQVLLCCDNQPWVYARTVIPLHSLRGPLRHLAQLGNRPLGAVLFADKTMRRGAMEVTSLGFGHPCYELTGYRGEEMIWGRRSRFWLSGHPLLVSEFFLPTLIDA